MALGYANSARPEDKKRGSITDYLVKSVRYFNTALVRNPWNVSEIKSDLSDVCKQILLAAGAKNQDADLLEKAEEVKFRLTEWRREVNEYLENSLPQIPLKASGTALKQLKKTKDIRYSATKQINDYQIQTNNGGYRGGK